MNLLQQVAAFENVESSFRICMRGKRSKLSPQLAFLKWDTYLEKIQKNILLAPITHGDPIKNFM